jgi:hypothetical protein
MEQQVRVGCVQSSERTTVVAKTFPRGAFRGLHAPYMT